MKRGWEVVVGGGGRVVGGGGWWCWVAGAYDLIHSWAGKRDGLIYSGAR